MQVSQREQEIDAIIRELMPRFGHCVTRERIAAEAEEAYDALCSTSKVKTFIPILAQRRARERVRQLAEGADRVAPSIDASSGFVGADGGQSTGRRSSSTAYAM